MTILNGGKPPKPVPPVVYDEDPYPRPVPPLGGPWPQPDRDPLPEPPTTFPRPPKDDETGATDSRVAPTTSPEKEAEYQAAYQKWVQDNWEIIQKNKELKAMGLPPLPVPQPPRDPRDRDWGVMYHAPTKPAPTFDPQAEAKRWVDWSREEKRKKDQEMLSRLGQGKPADPYPDHTISEDGSFEHDKYAENLVRDSNPHETARYLKNVISWNGDAGRGDVADLLGRFAKIDEAKAKALQGALHQVSGERIPFRIAPLAKDAGGPMADLAEGEQTPRAPANPFGSAEGADRWEAGNMARALLGKSDYQDAITHFKGEVAKDRAAAMPYLAAVHQEMAAKNPELAGKFASQMDGAGLTMKEEEGSGTGSDTLVGGEAEDAPPQGQTEGTQGDNNGHRQDGENVGQGNEGEQVSQGGQPGQNGDQQVAQTGSQEANGGQSGEQKGDNGQENGQQDGGSGQGKGGQENNEFRDKLHERESATGRNNGYEAANDGAYGRYQMRTGALQDAGYIGADGKWTGKNGVHSAEDFLKSPDAQEKAFSEYIEKTKGYLNANGSTKHQGQKIDGIKAPITITEAGLLAAAHRQGQGIVKEYLEHQKAHGWKSDASTFPPHRRDAFLSVETRLREFQDVPFR